MSEKEQDENRRETLRAVARGYVQGVGFRVFIRSRAWGLGVRGYVQNMPDGTVNVVAAGPHARLQNLLDEIWRGPAGAHVMSVETDWAEGEAPGLSPHFEVKH
jgi:acylphosphatase